MVSGAKWAMCIAISLSEQERFALYASSTHLFLGEQLDEVQRLFAALGALLVPWVYAPASGAKRLAWFAGMSALAAAPSSIASATRSSGVTPARRRYSSPRSTS